MALLGASTTMAVPAVKRNTTNQILCPGLEGTPQCCAVNALNLADLNCGPRTSTLCLLPVYIYTSSMRVSCYPREIVANLTFLFPAPMVPSTLAQFTSICASIGQQAQCCLLPVVSFYLFSNATPMCADQCTAVGPRSGLREPSGGRHLGKKIP